jgi:hypothetical protein
VAKHPERVKQRSTLPRGETALSSSRCPQVVTRPPRRSQRERIDRERASVPSVDGERCTRTRRPRLSTPANVQLGWMRVKRVSPFGGKATTLRGYHLSANVSIFRGSDGVGPRLRRLTDLRRTAKTAHCQRQSIGRDRPGLEVVPVCLPLLALTSGANPCGEHPFCLSAVAACAMMGRLAR